MTSHKYKVIYEEKDGTSLGDPTELALDTSDALLCAAALVLTPDLHTTATGTLVLTATNNSTVVFTGTAAGQILQLPDATTLAAGMRFEIFNQSSQAIVVKDAAGGVVMTLGQTSIGYLLLHLATPAAGTWISYQVFVSSLASGILSYNVVSSTAFATASATDVVITGFTVTPQAGSYAVWFNAAVGMTTTPTSHQWSIYRGGTVVADTPRSQITSRSNQALFDATQTINLSCDGTQAVDVRVQTAGGTLTVNQRSLILIRTGP